MIYAEFSQTVYMHPNDFIEDIIDSVLVGDFPHEIIVQRLSKKNLNSLMCVSYNGTHKDVNKNILQFIKLLLHYKADINSKDHDNRTAFHNAARNDILNVFKFLLPICNKNAKDSYGYTAFDYVIKKDIQMLQRFGYRSKIGMYLIKNKIIKDIPAAAVIKSMEHLPAEIKTKLIKQLGFGKKL
jgi:hypothetical protein